MIDIPWRLIGIGAAVVLVGVAMWRVNVWHDGYLNEKKAVAEFDGYKSAVADREKEAAKEREEAGKRSEILAVKLGNAQAELEALRGKPINPVVNREKPAANGKCDDPRVSPDFVGVWNEAADIATRAVHASD